MRGAMMTATILNKLRSVLSREDGAITVEGVLWIPAYIFFFAFIVDVSLMFNSKTQVQRVLQDVNRLASSGFFVTEEEIEDRVVASLVHLTDDVTVEATIDEDNNLVTTVASVPAEDLMAIGLVAKFASLELNFIAQHLVES